MPQGAFISIADGEEVAKGIAFVRWDPYTLPILTEVSGRVKFEDLREDVTVREELNPVTKLTERVVVEHKQEYHPQILILDEKEEVMGIYPIPIGAHILVKDGQKDRGRRPFGQDTALGGKDQGYYRRPSARGRII